MSCGYAGSGATAHRFTYGLRVRALGRIAWGLS
jgi:hypothetical protein